MNNKDQINFKQNEILCLDGFIHGEDIIEQRKATGTKRTINNNIYPDYEFDFNNFDYEFKG